MNLSEYSRRPSCEVRIGRVVIGGGHPVAVQSMTNTLTANVPATLQQIAELTAAGCDIVRVAVPSQDDADALNLDQDYRLTLLELGVTDDETTETA